MPPKKIIEPKLSLYKSSGESYDALRGPDAAKLPAVSSQSDMGVPKFAACAGRRSFKQSNWDELEREEGTDKRTSLSNETNNPFITDFQMPSTSGQQHSKKRDELFENNKPREEKNDINAVKIQQPRMNCHRRPADFARSLDGQPARITHYVNTEDEDRILSLGPKLGHKIPSIINNDESIMKKENLKMDPKELENIIDTELKGLKKTWLNRMGITKSPEKGCGESRACESKLSSQLKKGSFIQSKDVNEAWDRIKKQRYQLFQEKFMQSNCNDLQCNRNSILEVKRPVHLTESSDSTINARKTSKHKETKPVEFPSCSKDGQCPFQAFIAHADRERRAKSNVREDKSKATKPERRATSNDDHKRRALSKNSLERKTLLQCREGFVQVNPTACQTSSVQNERGRARSKVRAATVKVPPTGAKNVSQQSKKSSGAKSPTSNDGARGGRHRSSSKNRQRTQSRSRGGCTKISHEHKNASDMHKPLFPDLVSRKPPFNFGYMQVTTTFADVVPKREENTNSTRCANSKKMGDKQASQSKGLSGNKPTFNFQKGPTGDGLAGSAKTTTKNANTKEQKRCKSPLKIAAGQRNLVNIFDNGKRGSAQPRSKTPTYEKGNWKDPLSVFRATRKTPPFSFAESETGLPKELQNDSNLIVKDLWCGVPKCTKRGATQITFPTKNKYGPVTPRPMGTLDMNFGPNPPLKSTTFAAPLKNANRLRNLTDQPRPTYLYNVPMRCTHYNYVPQEPRPFRNLCPKSASTNNVNKQFFGCHTHNIKK